MIRNDKNIVVERSGEFDESSFGIDSDDVSLILEIIRNKLYTNKVGSYVREIVSNAYDAMIEAAMNRGESPDSVKNRQIEFTLPSSNNNNTLTIRDYGTGMSDDKIKKIYTRVGKSTRSGSNKFVGMMGIGRLVGFCLTDSFNVVSFVDGIRTEYLCYIDETKCGKVAMLSQAETKDPNGIAISVNVPEELHNELANELKAFTSYIDEVGIKFFSDQDQYDYSYAFRSLLESAKPRTIQFQGTGWVKYNDRIGSAAYVKMGIVKYPLPERITRGGFFNNGTVIFSVPIGEVNVGASREGLEFTPETKTYVDNLISNAKTEAAAGMFTDIKTAKDVKEACAMFQKHHEVWSSLDRPNVEFINPANGRKIILNDIAGKGYEACTYHISMKDELDANGRVVMKNGARSEVPELDATGAPLIYQIKHKMEKYEVREYKVDYNRRSKVDRIFTINLNYSDQYYFRLVDNHDVESLPDIRRCRTLFATGKNYHVFVFTKRGLAHFIDMNGFDPTVHMKNFETVAETILPRGTATRPPVEIKKVIFTHDPVTNKVEATPETSTMDLDNLAPGYWVSRHYSSILYNRSEMKAIDEGELFLLFQSITAFLKVPTILYILPAAPGRILDNLRKEGSDEYADLVPVYAWVDNLFKTTGLLDYLCSSTTDIEVNSWHTQQVVNIFRGTFNIKSPTLVELVDLIKKAVRPLVPGEIKVSSTVIDKLRALHNSTDNLQVRNFSEMLQTKATEIHKRFPLMSGDLNRFDYIERFFNNLPHYDEYIYAVENHRVANGITSLPVIVDDE